MYNEYLINGIEITEKFTLMKIKCDNLKLRVPSTYNIRDIYYYVRGYVSARYKIPYDVKFTFEMHLIEKCTGFELDEFYEVKE